MTTGAGARWSTGGAAAKIFGGGLDGPLRCLLPSRIARAKPALESGKKPALERLLASRFRQLAQGADNPLGADSGGRRQAVAAPIDPHAVQSQPLGSVHVELEMIARHPGFLGCGVERLEDVTVHDLLRLADAELALDQDDVEEAREPVPLDLVALQGSVAVRHERERHAAAPEVLEALDGVGEEAHRLAPARGEVAGDRRGQPVGLDAEVPESELHDVLPGAEHVHALAAVALGVVPEPAPGLGDGGQEPVSEARRRAGGHRRLPVGVHAARVVEQRVVEIEQECPHETIVAGAASPVTSVGGLRRGAAWLRYACPFSFHRAGVPPCPKTAPLATTPRAISTARSMSWRSMLGCSSPVAATIAGRSGTWMKPTRGGRRAPGGRRRPGRAR